MPLLMIHCGAIRGFGQMATWYDAKTRREVLSSRIFTLACHQIILLLFLVSSHRQLAPKGAWYLRPCRTGSSALVHDCQAAAERWLAFLIINTVIILPVLQFEVFFLRGIMAVKQTTDLLKATVQH